MSNHAIARAVMSVLIVAGSSALALADHPAHTPPPQAFEVCAKAKAADPCAFKGRHDHDVQGTCELPRSGGTALACRPPHRGSGS